METLKEAILSALAHTEDEAVLQQVLSWLKSAQMPAVDEEIATLEKELPAIQAHIAQGHYTRHEDLMQRMTQKLNARS